MQELAWVLRICAQNLKFTLFSVNKNTPHPPELELLMKDLGSLDLRLPRIPSLPSLDLCTWSWCVETNRCIPNGYHLVYDVS